MCNNKEYITLMIKELFYKTHELSHLLINMEVYDAILRRRSIRKFQQKPVSLDVLEKLVNAARLAPSAANLQPLEFYVVNTKHLCAEVFETLSWAGYIKPKWNPDINERPMGYIVIIVNNPKNPWFERDASFAALSICLTAESEDIGSCILCKIDKERLKKNLGIPDDVIVDSVVALGYKAEQPVVEDLVDSVEYWRDDKEVLHVPKRKIKDVMHLNKY